MLELEVLVQFDPLCFAPIKANKLAISNYSSIVEGRVDIEQEEISSVLAAETRVHSVVKLARLLDVLYKFYFNLAGDRGVASSSLLVVDLYKVGRGCSCILKADLIREDVNVWSAIRRLRTCIIRLS